MREEPKIMVNSYVTTHVKNTINPQDKDEYMKMICEYYIDLLANFFKTNGVFTSIIEPSSGI